MAYKGDLQRESEILRDMKECKHFNGIQHEQCRGGVVYRDLMGSDAGWAGHLPCFSDEAASVVCEKRKLPTREEVEADLAASELRLGQMVVALNAAHADAKKKDLGVGSGGCSGMLCPVCTTGTLRYSVASVNGHMHASCTTKGCVSWME
jgi:hypothetical protein